jgi:hypothetical protein
MPIALRTGVEIPNDVVRVVVSFLAMFASPDLFLSHISP